MKTEEPEEIESRLYEKFLVELSRHRRLVLVGDGHVYPSVWFIKRNGKDKRPIMKGSELAEYLNYHSNLLIAKPDDFEEDELVRTLVKIIIERTRTKEVK
jgi:hypothetical protein